MRPGYDTKEPEVLNIAEQTGRFGYMRGQHETEGVVQSAYNN